MQFRHTLKKKALKNTTFCGFGTYVISIEKHLLHFVFWCMLCNKHQATQEFWHIVYVTNIKKHYILWFGLINKHQEMYILCFGHISRNKHQETYILWFGHKHQETYILWFGHM